MAHHPIERPRVHASFSLQHVLPIGLAAKIRCYGLWHPTGGRTRGKRGLLLLSRPASSDLDAPSSDAVADAIDPSGHRTPCDEPRICPHCMGRPSHSHRPSVSLAGERTMISNASRPDPNRCSPRMFASCHALPCPELRQTSASCGHGRRGPSPNHAPSSEWTSPPSSWRTIALSTLSDPQAPSRN